MQFPILHNLSRIFPPLVPKINYYIKRAGTKYRYRIVFFFFFQSIANRSLIPLYHRERIKAGYTDPRTIDLIVLSFTRLPSPPVSLYHRLFVSATWKKVIRRLINAGANVICSQVSLESLDSAVVERARAEEWSFCEKERR